MDRNFSISETPTLCGMPASEEAKLELKLGPVVEPPASAASALPSISKGRKIGLLTVFALAQFFDLVNVSAVVIAIAEIAMDLQLAPGAAVWALTSYSLTFASCLLFGGRLADLWSPRALFTGGFFFLGIACLIMSFVNSKIAFLVLRALAGIGGSLTIPSAIKLIVTFFPEHEEQALALNIFALSGAVGNVLGLIISGVLLLASWRWLFRFLALSIIPLAIGSLFLIPSHVTIHDERSILSESSKPKEPKWKQLDIIGVTITLVALICWCLALTNGNIVGWKSPDFIAPFIISVLAFPAFFLWESRLPDTHALLPSKVWRYPSFTVLMVIAATPYAIWSSTQTQFSLYYQEVLHMRPLEVAVRLLPQGITSLIVGGIVINFPRLIARTRLLVISGLSLAIGGYILNIYSHGGQTKAEYFRWNFPGFIIGSMGPLLIFAAINSAIIQACPPEMSGVAGAAMNSMFQIGAITALSVQTGLTSTSRLQIFDWRASQVGFWALSGTLAVLAVGFLIFYRTPPPNEARTQSVTGEKVIDLESHGQQSVLRE